MKTHEKNAKQKTKTQREGNIISHSQKWQESELQIWKVTSGVLQRGKEVEKYPQGVMWAAGAVVQADYKGSCT